MSSLSPAYKHMIRKLSVLISFLAMLSLSDSLYSVGFSVTPIELSVNNVPVNQQITAGALTCSYSGTNLSATLVSEALPVGNFEVPAGYTAADPSWFSFEPNNTTILANSNTKVDVKANIPNPSGKYYTVIWSRAVASGGGFPITVASMVPLYVNGMLQVITPPTVIRLGTNIFFPPSRIGLTGNKFVVKLEVYSTGALKCDFYYRKIGSNSYNKVSLPVTGGSGGMYFSKAELPAYLVTPPGIEYYIEMKANGTTSLIPATAPVVPYRQDIDNRTLGKMTKKGGKLSVPDANPDDGETTLELPFNALSQDTDLTITQLDPESVPPAGSGPMLSTAPVMAFEFGPGGTSFKRPVKLSMLYFDLDNDGVVDGTNFKDKDLKLFWWDGFDWRLVGGALNAGNKTVYANISHFSMYALFPAGALIADDFRPKESIITPALKDHDNDFAAFDNLSGSAYEINIYDITGRLVRKLTDAGSSGPNWDGTDESGKVVESGVYIYQFKAEVNGQMKLISGTIAVAK